MARLTIEMLDAAISELPSHRTDLKKDLSNTRDLVRRGIPIKDNAPSWVRAQNVIFVSKVDVGETDREDES